MDFEHLKRIFLVKNGFLIYNFIQIVVIISIIYYVRILYFLPLTFVDITRLPRKVRQTRSKSIINACSSFKKPVVILGEFYVTVSLIIEVVLRLSSESENDQESDNKNQVSFLKKMKQNY